ncbi:uncharacterized protein LOC117609444 isoform X3 [Osmia lignaria lignaria]|uniref:uncharacterized protein LOC117609444 isoform X3 n=1 Tax=Osmia lignaria lignaria TaxID=1437193 RepID=UPI00402B5733
MESLGDDSTSTEEIRPSFNPNDTNLYKTGNNSTVNESESSNKDSAKKLQRKLTSSSDTDDYNGNDQDKQISKSGKQESGIKNKKAYCNSTRKKAHKSRELKCSNSGDKKHSERRHSILQLNKEEADSSSGKEFQKSKFSRNTDLVKKLYEIKKGGNSDSLGTKHSRKKTLLCKKQSLRFKSYVIKILNKFKILCSEYELMTEHVKWENFNEELQYQESAYYIVKKVRKLINDLKMEIDAQNKKLVNFFEKWNKNCSIENTDHEDSSSSGNKEVLLSKSLEEITNKSKTNSKEGSVVSECDNKEIFSDSDTTTKIIEKMSEDSSGNSSRVTSPILGSKMMEKIHNKVNVRDNSKPVDSNEKVLKVSHVNENKKNINESVDDVFEESMTKNVSASNISKPNENEIVTSNDLQSENNSSESKEVSNETAATENDNLEIESEKLFDDEVKTTTATSVDSKGTSESVENDKNKESEENKKNDENKKNEEYNSLNGLDEEEAKIELLDSNQETVINKGPIEKSIEESQNCSPNEKGKSKCKEITPDSSKELITSLLETIKDCVKRAHLDSNSDDSINELFDNNESDDNSDEARAKAKLLISSNAESLDSSFSSDIDGDIESTILNTSSKKSNDTENFESSVGERLIKRQLCLSKANSSESDEKLKQLCQVVVERLPKSVLVKHANALEKSREYLESKRIKSLIHIDKLQKNQEKNTLTRKNSHRKKLTLKETEDSLLDHLEKVKNGDIIEDTEKGTNSEGSSTILQAETTFQSKDDLMLEADIVVKNMLLNSSDSDTEEQKGVLENGDSEKEKDNAMSQDQSKKSSDKKNEDKLEKNSWRTNKVLTMKFSSSSDSDAKREEWSINREKLRESREENQNEDSEIEAAKVKCKRKNRRKITDSDSDTLLVNSDSSFALKDSLTLSSDSSTKKHKSRKRRTRKSSDTDTSFSEKRVKPKRRRIKNASTDSDDIDNDKVKSSEGKESRKNIRKVMKDKQVANDTKQAAKEEEERLKRIAERQKLYNQMYETRLANEEKVDELVLDFDTETKEKLLSVDKDLVKRLKPHQAKGVKFMWDACFESIERMKTSPGSGCIIAHCMGLGKTLQVIALAHTLLMHEDVNVKTIMVVCPLSTVLNWRNEFDLWLDNIEHDIEIYELTRLKQNTERRYMLESWQRTGGILIIGYEMFRNLSGTNNRMPKYAKKSVLQCLIDPGPDIIVCDEGHLLKNEDTALSKCINRIKTLRRIVLTGTPLQNNLIEYHCMVQFIKPNLLGTKKEFVNRFANPITNGQFDDSTEYDVKLMKKRAYVLHKMLKGCVQRLDYSVLMPFLPPKQEYVIFVRLTEVQINLYRYYLENFARQKRTGGGGGFLFADFQSLQRIWTHPIVLQLNAEKIDKMNEKKLSSDSEGSLKNFIDDDSSETTSTESSDDDDDVVAISSDFSKKNTRQNKTEEETNVKTDDPEPKEELWWLQFVQPEHFEDMRVSSKLRLLFGILKECEQIGDKLLIFSQSLYSLTLIEKFLKKIDVATEDGTNLEYIDGHTGSWTLGLDYFRLDGQTSTENRNCWCKIFNKPSNTRARLFLISTRAGGLGINLTAANRVIIFDASWNPSYDVQSIFRIYRFGQKKPCYVYRFLAAGTMEEKIYNRQVTKLSLSCRVVDVQQIERHYTNNDLSELYKFEPNTSNEEKTLNLPKDRLLREIFLKYKKCVENYHEHDSLLENKAEEELNEEERKQAWLEYEEEKTGKLMPGLPTTALFPNNLLLQQQNLSGPFNFATDYEQLQEFIRKDYPNATAEYQQMLTARALTDMYNYWEEQTFNSNNRIINQNLGTNAPVMRTQQMLNVPQTSYALLNTNAKSASTDNDVIEILPNTTSNTSKSKEE